MTSSSYVLAGQDSELERLRLQSRVWEPSGQHLLDEIGSGQGLRVLDVGCGAMCWLRLLSKWVGPSGQVVGTDIDDAMLSAADSFVAEQSLRNVALIKDDIFATDLEPASFDLVHGRFQLSLGRPAEQMAAYVRLVRPGGTVVVEDVNPNSWQYVPKAPSLAELINLIRQVFAQLGLGDPSVVQLDMFRDAGIVIDARTEVIALPPGHPYQRLPLQFAKGLHAPLEAIAGADELARLEREAEQELQDPGRWGVTFTLFQTWGRRPS
ncbi:MAG: methyltransferase domain-containing protein [Actinophytocola sp.]|nr:methyltransferase domain-containing protein [Actinophytocola sp.]